METKLELFTARQRDVIRLLVEQRLTSSEAASVLKVSPNTVKIHRQDVYRRLRKILKMRRIGIVDLVLFAMARGLVDAERIWAPYRLPILENE